MPIGTGNIKNIKKIGLVINSIFFFQKIIVASVAEKYAILLSYLPVGNIPKL